MQLELPPKQKTVYDAAQSLAAQGKIPNPRNITEVIEPKAFDFTAAMSRTKSTIDILRRKKIWEFQINPNGQPKTVVLDESRVLPITTPAPNQPIALESLCKLHDTPSDAEHDFAVRVMEAFTKLSRASQRKLWAVVGDLIDKAMPEK